MARLKSCILNLIRSIQKALKIFIDYDKKRKYFQSTRCFVEDVHNKITIIRVFYNMSLYTKFNSIN
jgi:hypothetical protein